MTDVVQRVSTKSEPCGQTFLTRTKRYTVMSGAQDVPLKITPQATNVASSLAAILENRKRTLPLQSGWQREVGIVPQSAYSEGVYKFKFRNGQELAIPETFDAIGTRVWDCAPCMSRWFEKGDLVRGKTILELGAGTGLLGLACAALGAKKVVLTDIQSIHKAMQKSIDATGFSHICEARTLDWNDVEAVRALKKEFGSFDMIVASDVLVFAVDASVDGESGLVKALRHLAEPGKTEILMGCNKNRHGFLVGFYANPPHHLLDIHVVNKSEVDEDFYTDMIMLYRMHLKDGKSVA